jgi:hypothetical protein
LGIVRRRLLRLFLGMGSTDAERESNREQESSEDGGAKSHKSSLRHYDYITREKGYILGFAFEDVLIIIRMLHLFAVLGAKDVDVLFASKLRKAAGSGKSLQSGHARKQGESAGVSDLAGNKDPAAVDLRDGDSNLGTVEKLGEAFTDIGSELHGGEASGLDIVQERQRDFSVGTYGNGAGNFGLFPNVDVDDILWADEIVDAAGSVGGGSRSSGSVRLPTGSGRLGDEIKAGAKRHE